MADFAPPPGPPPPRVPEGWKAVYNDQYKEWFYVNTHTKASQWDKPTEAVYAAPSGGAPPGAPPGYDHSSTQPTGPEKGFGSNNPYSGGGGSGMSSDERLARQLQAEEEARMKSGSGADRGASDGYYGQQQSTPQYGQAGVPQYGQGASPYGQQSASPQSGDQSRGKGGLFSKLTSKLGGGGSSSRPPQYGGGGYPQQQQYGGGFPQQQYGGYPPQQGYGGYQQQPMYGQPQRKQGGGMGAGGGALLGAGAGLVGGALLMDAVDDHDQNEYQDGYQDGQDNGGGDDGGDYGGGDDGGGDF